MLTVCVNLRDSNSMVLTVFIIKIQHNSNSIPASKTDGMTQNTRQLNIHFTSKWHTWISFIDLQ